MGNKKQVDTDFVGKNTKPLQLTNHHIVSNPTNTSAFAVRVIVVLTSHYKRWPRQHKLQKFIMLVDTNGNVPADYLVNVAS